MAKLNGSSCTAVTHRQAPDAQPPNDQDQAGESGDDLGHSRARLMDGGRIKWKQEGREMIREVPGYAAADYPVPQRDDAPIRAYRRDVEAHLEAGGAMVDVRSPEEYTGERLHMPDYPNEGALRGGCRAADAD